MSIEVTQADRDAAANLAEWLSDAQSKWEGMGTFFIGAFPDAVRSGVWDNHDWVQAFARHRQQAVAAEIAQIVAGLKRENGLCDCSARSEGECACGAWYDYKTWPLERVWEWIERGEYKETSGE